MTFACICTVMRLPKNKTGRKCAWLCVFVGWGGVHGWARVGGPVCFPATTTTGRGMMTNSNLNTLILKSLRQTKKGRGPRIDAILIGNTYLATPAVDDLVMN